MEDIIIEQRPEKKTVTNKKVVKTKVKVRQKQSFFSYLANLFNKTAIVSLLIILDFLLFCRAGNINIFSDASWWLNKDTQYIWLGIIIVSFLLMLISSVFRCLQSFVVAVIVAGLTWGMINQFALFDKEAFLLPMARELLGNDIGAIFEVVSLWFVVGVVFLFSWAFFAWSRKKVQFKLFLLLLVILFFMAAELCNHINEKNDFVELYADKVITADKKGNNFVYIAVPNLPSYRYLERISPKYPTAKNTLNAMLGLYTKNGFMLYTNAYHIGRDKYENLAQSFNMSTEGNLLDKKAKYNQSWNFKQISSNRAELNKNALVDAFEKNGYIRKIFEDRSIELCFMEGKQSANTCVRREMMPYIPEQITGRARVMMLLGQWLGSMNIFSSSSALYKIFKSFGIDDVPFLGMDYANIPALGGIETLDVVAEDIAESKGNRAYFVWLSLPSDGYIYDEFCQIKPIEKWVVKGGKPIDEEKRINAYFEQTSCVFGKLADFMRKLKEMGADENTVVFLQGVSGLEMQSLKKIDNFEANQMVTMAIKDPKHNKFTINKQFCSAPKIVRQYLFKKEKCTEQEGLKFDPTFKKEIIERIDNHNVITQTSIKTLNEFGEWFRNWMRANYKDMVIPIEMPVVAEEQTQEEVVEAKPEELSVDSIKNEAEIKVKEIKLHTDETKDTVDVVKEESQNHLTTTDKVQPVEDIEDKKPEIVQEPIEVDDNIAVSNEVVKASNEMVKILEEAEVIEEIKEENNNQEENNNLDNENIISATAEVGNIKNDNNDENLLPKDDEKVIKNQKPNGVELKPGEEVVVLPQGENKADKIIIRINETEEEKVAEQVKAEKIKAEKIALEEKVKAEKAKEEAKAKVVEEVTEALDGPSVDELGQKISQAVEKLEDKEKSVDALLNQVEN